MSIDFFNTSCAEAPQATKEFGLCDDQNSRKAYSNVDDSSKWIAIVKNENKIRVQFTPIDNCMNIKKYGSNDLESTCDGMLTFENSIYLVELKDRKKGGASAAKDQLKNTIRLLYVYNSDELSKTNKKAFVCIKGVKPFKVINHEEKTRFLRETNFRLDENSLISIK